MQIKLETQWLCDLITSSFFFLALTLALTFSHSHTLFQSLLSYSFHQHNIWWTQRVSARKRKIYIYEVGWQVRAKYAFEVNLGIIFRDQKTRIHKQTNKWINKQNERERGKKKDRKIKAHSFNQILSHWDSSIFTHKLTSKQSEFIVWFTVAMQFKLSFVIDPMQCSMISLNSCAFIFFLFFLFRHSFGISLPLSYLAVRSSQINMKKPSSIIQ